MLFAATMLTAQPAAAFLGSHYEQLYLDAVNIWLESPSEEAAEALVELEVGARGPKLNRLDEAAERMAKDLGRINPDALLPIAALHQHAYAIHLEADHLKGARHSAQRLRSVVNFYVRRTKTPEARAVAARLWTRLGLSLLARGGDHLSPSIACLSEALRHAKKRRGETDELREARVRAWHIRAIVLERIGAAPKALDDLEDLLEDDPDHLEARLRQAVNLMHDEQLAEAEGKLRSLAGLESPDWIAIVASQQLARLLIDQGREKEAKSALKDAVERFPNNARLGVLLAYQERPRWQTASRRVSGLLENWPNARSIRPRARYEGPIDDQTALYAATDQDVNSRLDAARAAMNTLEARRAEK